MKKTMKKSIFKIQMFAIALSILAIQSCKKDEKEKAEPTGGGVIVSNPGKGVTFDEHTYPSVVLGNGQEWMAENLRTTIYSNGDPITYMPMQAVWATIEEGAYCFYNNQTVNNELYGKLYNGYVIEDSRNVCPQGWRVPSDEDWNTLEKYLGLTDFDISQSGGSRGTNQGEHLKSTRTEPDEHPRFCSPNNATNSTGFNALPAGSRLFNGYGQDIGFAVYYWSSTYYRIASNLLWVRSLSCGAGAAGTIGKITVSKEVGICIRCIKE